MFSTLKNLLFPPSEKELLSELQKVVADLEVSDVNEEKQDFELKKCLDNVCETQDCFRKTGKITSINEENGFIDNYYFDRKIAGRNIANLEKGMTVSYLAYKQSEDNPVRIVLIDQVIDYWELESDNIHEVENIDKEYFSHHERIIPTKVTVKNKDYLEVEEDDFIIKLDEVSCDFVPQENDYVNLTCQVQTDEDYFAVNGQIIKVLSISAGRLLTEIGKISIIVNSGGVIDNTYMYFNDALETNYKPQIGDSVCFSAIECDRDPYFFRCIKVTLHEKVKEEKFSKRIAQSAKPERINEKADNGITYTKYIKFEASIIKEQCVSEITVTNDDTKTHKIVSFQIMDKKLYSQINIISPDAKHEIELKPSESVDIVIQFQAMFTGNLTHKVKIKFEDDSLVMCDIDVVVELPQTYRRSSQQRNIRCTADSFKRTSALKYIPGQTTAKKSNFVYERIDLYKLPESLVIQILDNQTFNATSAVIDECMPETMHSVVWSTYKKILHSLINLEEINMLHLMKSYDMERRYFLREGPFLTLTVENLAERRPSLAIGDTLLISSILDETSAFEGFIHKILKNKICIKFNDSLHKTYNGEDYKIVFRHSRMRFRKLHHGINKATINFEESFFFPKKVMIRDTLQLDVVLNDEGMLQLDGFSQIYPWFNQRLNKYQKAAVKNILRGETRPSPYIIFGPPGTGKTVTLIEIILQLVTLVPECRIIVATPSNSAANCLTTKLIESGRLKIGEFVRLVSHNLVEKEMIPESLAPYCATLDISLEHTTLNETIVTQSGLRLKCKSTEIGRSKITIGTCTTLGTLFQLKFHKNHFTHVIIDEAGQCMEPEVLIPISLINKSNGQVILAGDPMQLDPVVLCNHAAQRGLSVSFLVRMLEQYPYQKDDLRFDSRYDPRYVTQLRYNYRSIPSILDVYSELFYDSKLIAQVNDVDSAKIKLLHSFDNILPNPSTRNKNCGLFFFNITGKNLQSDDSPSWYNSAEATRVFQFVVKLYKNHVSPDSIGIITPYQKQVKTIRSVIEMTDLIVPKVGSVEEFQGQERDIILISTVRSSDKDYQQHDMKYSLGFVREPKRLNVAISRATTLCVIFGNANLLSQDKNWKRVIDITIENRTFVS